MKEIFSSLKPYLRWFIFGATLFFLGKALKDHWREVATLRIAADGWRNLAIALGFTLIAHFCAGWVWTSILQAFQQPVGQRWALQIYLKTNLAKYLPGNVWHFYGRISALTKAGISLSVASLSVLLEPLLLAAAALAIALGGSGLGWMPSASKGWIWGLQILGLGVVLGGIHPRVLNFTIRVLRRFKGNISPSNSPQIERYPLLPFLGALCFLGLRGMGFAFTLLAVMPVPLHQTPQLLSAFSFAWLLGLVIPGAPGGLGVFEATALALLEQEFSVGLLLSGLALFRLVSLLAEISGAGLAVAGERYSPR